MKKLNKLFAILVAMAMVLSLSVVSAFAAGEAKETTLEEAFLTKTFTIPKGVKDPDITTSFTFTEDLTNSKGIAEGEHLPAITGSTQIVYDGDGNVLTADKSDKQYIPLADIKPVFTHAGVYAYTVKENDPTISNTDENGTCPADPAEYTVRFYVKNVEKTNPETNEKTVELEVTNVTVSTNAADDNTGKVSATKTAEGFKFSNVYSVTAGTPSEPGTPINPNTAALKVTKTVDGTTTDGYAFPFEIALTAAAGQSLDDIVAYKYTTAGAPVLEKASADATEETAVAYKPVNGVIEVELKAGEMLAFPTLPVGTDWQVTEKLTDDKVKFNAYTPSVVATTNDTATTTKKGAAEDCATGTGYLVANKHDSAAYTNKYDNSINTPTGILMNNLPYIVLALVAIGGLVAYVVVRRRNADEA